MLQTCHVNWRKLDLIHTNCNFHSTSTLPYLVISPSPLLSESPHSLWPSPIGQLSVCPSFCHSSPHSFYKNPTLTPTLLVLSFQPMFVSLSLSNLTPDSSSRVRDCGGIVIIIACLAVLSEVSLLSLFTLLFIIFIYPYMQDYCLY